jgi:hypothetical protein
MVLAYRIVRLIETHSEQLSASEWEAVRTCERTPVFQEAVPGEKFKATVVETYRQLGKWLLGQGECDIQRRYVEIGRRRHEQGVPLPQLIWAIVMIKDHLWDFLKKNSKSIDELEDFPEQQVHQQLGQFFDRVIYCLALGYESTTRAVGVPEC